MDLYSSSGACISKQSSSVFESYFYKVLILFIFDENVLGNEMSYIEALTVCLVAEETQCPEAFLLLFLSDF